jgi:hypothetical protein
MFRISRKTSSHSIVSAGIYQGAHGTTWVAEIFLDPINRRTILWLTPSRSDVSSNVRSGGWKFSRHKRQLLIAADRANASLIPGVTCSGSGRKPVQCRGYLIIWKPARHPANNLDRLQICATAVLAGEIFLEAYLGVAASRTVDHQHYLRVGLIHISDNLFHQNANDALLQALVRSCRVPNGGQLLSQTMESFFVRDSCGDSCGIVRQRLPGNRCSTSPTDSKEAFQRASNSAATRRLSATAS